MIAHERFPGKLWAVVYTGTKPPISCLIDGVQFTSGCTTGKGNIRVKDENKPMTMFYDQNIIIEIRLKEDWVNKIEREMSRETEEALALEVFEATDEDLFRIVRAESLLEERIVKL